jgi:uncharacterized membrane protein
MDPELALLREQARIELKRLESAAPAKDVAGKAIGKHGLAYITLIVVIGVGASIVLENEKIAAVMGLLGASLTALISMLTGIAGASPKQEKPEFEVIKSLIERLDRLDRPDRPMRVDVEGDKVTVTHGDHAVSANRAKES